MSSTSRRGKSETTSARSTDFSLPEVKLAGSWPQTRHSGSVSISEIGQPDNRSIAVNDSR